MSHDWHNNICSRSYNGTAKTNTIIDDHHPPVSTAFNPSARYTKPNNAPIETQKETGSTMTIHNSLSELIGNTPLVKLHHVTDGIKATIAVKVEYFNPGGSSKDRIAERIIDAAERSGQLKPGGVIVEPTSGNTGVGLALVAQQRGYRTIFTLPDKVSESKRAVLRAYGAEVVVTPTDAGPDDPRSYYQVAERLANTIPGGFRPNQYDNPNGPLSHYYTTGPEIWEATDHKVTHFVAGIGTGGTISGTGKYLKEVSDGAVTVVGSDCVLSSCYRPVWREFSFRKSGRF